MDVERAIERMDRDTLNYFKQLLDAFRKSGSERFLEEMVKILQNYSDDDADKIKRLLLKMR